MKMSNNARTPSRESVFLKCKCGGQIEVVFYRCAGDSETEEFKCPECKHSHKVKVSMAIKVEEIKIRRT